MALSILTVILLAVPVPSAPRQAVEPPAAAQEYQQDIASLNAIGDTTGAVPSDDLAHLAAVTDGLKEKWKPRDVQKYLGVLSEACDDLSRYDTDPANRAQAQALAEGYAREGLAVPGSLPLTMKADFVAHLNDVTDGVASRLSPEEWRQLRREHAKLWLTTWLDISRNYDPDFSFVGTEPYLPDQKYLRPRTFIINGSINPDDITNAREKARWVNGWKRYYAGVDRAGSNEQTGRLLGFFAPRAMRYLILAYSTAPFDEKELAHFLRFSLPDDAHKKEFQAWIMNETRQRISGRPVVEDDLNFPNN